MGLGSSITPQVQTQVNTPIQNANIQNIKQFYKKNYKTIFFKSKNVL